MNATVKSLHVYPVKGMKGIEVSEARATDRGLEHDRRWMVVDPAGEFFTQRSHPKLATVWTELELPGSPDLPHAKAGVRPRGPSYRGYYDDASRDRVAALFAAPIADLGYEF